MTTYLSRRRLAYYIAEQLISGKDHATLLKQVAAYLVAHKQATQVELLVRDVTDVLAREHGIVLAEVVSARELSSELRQAITSFIAAQHEAKAVQLEETVKPELIGGVIVRTPGAEFDSSIRSQLKALRA